MRVEIADQDVVPEAGEILFAVEYLVRVDSRGAFLLPQRLQRCATMAAAEFQLRAWLDLRPSSDLHQGKGPLIVVKRRSTVCGVVGMESPSPRLIWESVRATEQRKWPVRLRLPAQFA